MKNSTLIEMTKDIVIALASTSSQYHADKQSAQNLTEAMQVIYDKLVELNNNDKNKSNSRD